MNLLHKMRSKTGQLNIGIASSLCLFLVILLFSFIMIVRYMAVYDGDDTVKRVDLNSGWQYEGSDESVDLTNLKNKSEDRKGYTLLHTLDADAVTSGDLCLTTKGIEFEVFLNDNLVYNYKPDHVKIFGKSEGIRTHVIPLLNEYRDSEIRILYVPIYESSRLFIKDIVIDSGATYFTQVINSNISMFSVCLLSFILGLILVLFSLFKWNTSIRHIEFLAIGLFNMAISMWMAVDIGFLGYVTGEYAACHFVDYLLLMFVAYPPLLYVCCIVGQKNSIFLRAGAYACCGNMALQTLSTVVGFKDYHELLFLSHAVIIYCLGCTFYYLIYGIKNKLFVYFRKPVLIVFLFTAVCAVGDMVMYIVGNSLRSGVISFRFPLLAFGVVTAIFEIRFILQLSHKGEKIDRMEYMAYHDALTGLYNRQAYFREEDSLRKEMAENEMSNLSYMFVQFDVNNLKTMNDTYGHDAGDALISGAAIIIQQTFGQNAKVFRMGGDEFLALRPCYLSEDIDNIVSEFNSLVDMFNESSNLPLPLSIAYGVAIYRPGFSNACQTIEDAYRVSDSNMYDMKIGMKNGQNVR